MENTPPPKPSASASRAGPDDAPGRAARPRHLHPTIPAYVQSRVLADSYDDYFANSALFRHDERFVVEHLNAAPAFERLLRRKIAEAEAEAEDEGADRSVSASKKAKAPAAARRALDLGFGTGRHGLLLARAGWAVTGVDLNPHMLEKARAKLAAAGVPVDEPAAPPSGQTLPRGGDAPGSVRLLQADWHALPLGADEGFDAVLLLFSALGLVRPASRRLSLLRALRARLAPRGRLLLHAHNANWQPGPGVLMGGTLPGTWRGAWNALGRLWPGGRSTDRSADGKAANPTDSVAATSPDADAPRTDDPRQGEDACAPPEPGDRIMRGYRGGDVDLFLHAFALDELRGLLAAAGYRIRELRPLSPERAVTYHGSDPDREANGFLICAEPG